MGRDRNKGYQGWSRSVRAAEARDNGEAPLSHWTKAAIIAAIAEVFGDDVAGQASLANRSSLRRWRLEKSGWHHRGSYCRPVDFYRLAEVDQPEAVSLIGQAIAETDQEKKMKDKDKEEKEKVTYWRIAADEWEGSRRHGRYVSRTYFGITVGLWSTKAAIVAGGGDKTVKDLSGRHCRGIMIPTRSAFVKAVKKFLKIDKIGNFSKKIDEILKK